MLLPILCHADRVGTTAFVAYIFKDVINKIFYERREDLIPCRSASALLGAFILRGLATYGQSVTMAKIGNNIVARYQQRIFDHLMKLGLDFYNDTRSGQLAAQVNQNVSGVRELMDMTVTSIGTDFYAGRTDRRHGLLDPVLSLIALLVGPPAHPHRALSGERLRSIHRESVTVNSHLLGAMQEATQGIAIVKAFTMEDQLRVEDQQARSGAPKSVPTRSRAFRSALTPITELIAGFAIAIDDHLYRLSRDLQSRSRRAPCSAS